MNLWENYYGEKRYWKRNITHRSHALIMMQSIFSSPKDYLQQAGRTQDASFDLFCI